METIKNYLETMFANMPNTAQVLKAKDELYSMMEDKYNELMAEGVSENAAVGQVIAEFGNLDELAEVLGLEAEMKNQSKDDVQRRKVTLEEAKEYIGICTKKGFYRSLGIFLCIIASIGPIICDALETSETAGVVSMFACIAIAVGFFIVAANMDNEWEFIKKEPCQVDLMTADYLKNEKKRNLSTYTIQRTIGVVLCVLCFVPVVIMDSYPVLSDISAAILLVMVGIGVFLIVSSASLMGAITQLLNLNDSTKVAGEYVKTKDGKTYINDTAKVVMTVYWKIVLCIYLVWSFLTFDWHFTWIVWPIGAAVHGILNACLVVDEA